MKKIIKEEGWDEYYECLTGTAEIYHKLCRMIDDGVPWTVRLKLLVKARAKWERDAVKKFVVNNG